MGIDISDDTHEKQSESDCNSKSKITTAKLGSLARIVFAPAIGGNKSFVVELHDKSSWDIGAIFNTSAFQPNISDVVEKCFYRMLSVYSNLNLIFECHKSDLIVFEDALNNSDLGLNKLETPAPFQVIYASSKMTTYLLGFFASIGAFLDSVSKLSGAILTNGKNKNIATFAGKKKRDPYIDWLKENAAEQTEIISKAKEMSLFYNEVLKIRNDLLHCNEGDPFIPLTAIFTKHLNPPIRDIPTIPWRLKDGRELLGYLASIETQTRSLLKDFLALHPFVEMNLLNLDKPFNYLDSNWK
jgi:hypothetical protein